MSLVPAKAHDDGLSAMLDGWFLHGFCFEMMRREDGRMGLKMRL